MSNFFEKIKSFLGFHVEPPRNDFRNPIWGTDDDDDGDELYARNQIEIYKDPLELQQEITRHMQDIFKSFGSMFGDMKFFFHDDPINSFPSITDAQEDPEVENFDSNRIRDYYLKPGYHIPKHDNIKEDVDLDGRVSSNDISDLFRRKQDGQNIMPDNQFNGNMVPGRSFCQTIITTSITKPDGTVETKRIVKNGHEVVEETITTTEPSGINPVASSQFVLPEISLLLRKFFEY
ncbi:uncharacterized protein LOC126976146 [Leptidea sinapis]|uniref:uncharacterized protein LOC126976146 n=1 Tax=Leptidea sinapis TaxID=189913 RepID=UPI002131A4F5|nr:uncharacterized protein LOC126976146 [Leptidea sinapis]